jgi:hypothetical protein
MEMEIFEKSWKKGKYPHSKIPLLAPKIAYQIVLMFCHPPRHPSGCNFGKREGAEILDG